MSVTTLPNLPKTTIAAPSHALTAVGERKSLPWRLIFGILLYGSLIFFTVLFVAPFVWLVSNSLKDSGSAFDPTLIPQPVEWQNYVRIFQEIPLLRMAINTIFVTVLGVGSVLISSSMIAFALARLRFPGRNIVFLGVLGTMLMPGAVTMIPVYLIWKALNLTGTLTPLWLGNVFGSSFYIFMLRQFFLGIPQDIIEAARVDGASYFGIYWRLMLPLARPALIAVAIFEFQAKWNDFMGPLIYVQKGELVTLSLGLQQFVQRMGYGQFRWELLFAASVVVTLPMMILYLMAQKQFIEGIATTGSKG